MSDEQTTTDACEGCRPDPLTATVTPLRFHPDLEIPEFLLRRLHPEYATAVGPVTSTAGPDRNERGDYGINRYRPYETEKDRAERATWLAAEEARIKGNKQVAYVERDAKKRAEQEALLANKLKQREVFVQHFKWDWEK